MRTVTRCYTYRLQPTSTQVETLAQWAGCRRFVSQRVPDWVLRCKQTQYQATGQRLNYSQLAAALVALKRQPKTAFLRDCHSHPLQQALMDVETAFTNFFAKRAKYPRFKSRKITPHSLRLPQRVVMVDERTISVPKIGQMRAVIYRPLLRIAKGLTIKHDATGAWWVVFVCYIDRPNVQPTANNPVGIDVGLESFTTLSTGAKTAPPKFYRRSQKNLARAQRKRSRTQKGSNKRLKARKRVAKIHQKISNQRADWLHKHALGIVQRFDMVCIEDLNIKGLVKPKLAKSFKCCTRKRNGTDGGLLKLGGSIPHQRPVITARPKPPWRWRIGSGMSHLWHDP